MTIELNGGSVELIEQGDIVHLAHLQVPETAPPGTLIAIFKKVLNQTKGKTLRCVVEGQPGYERLIKAYQTMGMTPYGILMEKQN